MPNLHALAAKLPKSFTIGTDTFIATRDGYVVKLKRGRKAGVKVAGKAKRRKSRRKQARSAKA